MRIRTAIFCIAVIIFLPAKMFAQMDEHKPGLYTIIEGEAVPLKYDKCTSASNTRPVVRYDGETSGVRASDKFLLVINPDRIVHTNKNPFTKDTTPSNMMVIRLDSKPEKKYREYEAGEKMEGILGTIYVEKTGMEFEWERISDNSFIINVLDLTPGEYGIVFSATSQSEFEYIYGVFGFTVPESTEAGSAIREYTETTN